MGWAAPPPPTPPPTPRSPPSHTLIPGQLYNLLSVFVPPLSVAFKTGDGCETLINLGLTILGYFPGLLHALVVILGRARRWGWAAPLLVPTRAAHPRYPPLSPTPRW